MMPVWRVRRWMCRSPYGERGLKFALNRAAVSGSVALLTESVD